ncbi:MAG: VanW family protein [Rubrobacteraceae bacterium]
MEVAVILKRPEKKPGSGGRGESRTERLPRANRSDRTGFRFVGPVLIVCAVVAVLVAADYSMNAGKIYRGVSVGGIDLGGATPAEAEELIQERATGAVEEINLSGSEEFTFSAEEMGVDYNVEATVEEAFSVGREGGIFERLSERARGSWGTIVVEPDVDFQPEAARGQVEEIASELNAEPREAEVNIFGAEVEVIDSSEGYRMDVEETMESVSAAVDDMSGQAEIVGEVLTPELLTNEAERAAERVRGAMDGQLLISGAGERWTVPPDAIGASLDITTEGGDFQVSFDREAMRRNLAGVYDTIERPAVEAEYVVDGTNVSVTPSQEGRSIQSEEFLGAIENNIFTGLREHEVPIVVDRPELTTAQAEQMKPTEMLGEYSTNYMTYDDTPGRVTNLKIGSNAVDGKLVAPGEVFSFNAFAEQYEYEDAGAIIDGQVDEAEGGGLCQVSSTLYMAANNAGLEMVERHPHFAELPYIRPGFDATVWFGVLDMKFRNNTEGYLLVQEEVDTTSGEVYSAIYGVPQNVEVDMNSEKVGESTDSDGNAVTEWITYKTVSRDGRIEFDNVLHEDTYEYLAPAE